MQHFNLRCLWTFLFVHLLHLLHTWPAPSAVFVWAVGAQLPLRTLTMPEETPAGTHLANVATDLVALLSTNLSASSSASAGGSGIGSGGKSEDPLRFSLLTGSGAQEFVSVNASTGALLVARPFDREAACDTLRTCCPNTLNGNGNGLGNGTGASGVGRSQAQMLVSSSVTYAGRASNCALELTVRASRDSRYLLLEYRINGAPEQIMLSYFTGLFHSVFNTSSIDDYDK